GGWLVIGLAWLEAATLMEVAIRHGQPLHRRTTFTLRSMRRLQPRRVLRAPIAISGTRSRFLGRTFNRVGVTAGQYPRDEIQMGITVGRLLRNRSESSSNVSFALPAMRVTMPNLRLEKHRSEATSQPSR